MIKDAIVLSNGYFDSKKAKTAHGLIRYSERYKVVAVIDPVFFGREAGEMMDGRSRGIPMIKDVETFLQTGQKVHYCIIGVAPKGGRLPEEMRKDVITAIKAGISIVSGLHQFLNEDSELKELAFQYKVEIIDIRMPRPKSELKFWDGSIYKVPCPKVAVLGTDCGLGKRTTARFLVESLNQKGLKSEMIFTGQTGWMQGGKYGFILDSTYNDFVSGEIESAVVRCYEAEKPDIILLEGQSALRNPGGPCGAEFMYSANLDGVILQHAPWRQYYDGYEHLKLEIPPIETEIELIAKYGFETLAITFNTRNMAKDDILKAKEAYEKTTGLAVCLPVEDGVESVSDILIEKFKLAHAH